LNPSNPFEEEPYKAQRKELKSITLIRELFVSSREIESLPKRNIEGLLWFLLQEYA